MPSIEQMIPWLHRIFDAWEEHRRMREHETAEQKALEAAVRDDAFLEPEDEGFDEDGDHRKKNRKKKKKKKK